MELHPPRSWIDGFVRMHRKVGEKHDRQRHGRRSKRHAMRVSMDLDQRAEFDFPARQREPIPVSTGKFRWHRDAVQKDHVENVRRDTFCLAKSLSQENSGCLRVAAQTDSSQVRKSLSILFKPVPFPDETLQ